MARVGRLRLGGWHGGSAYCAPRRPRGDSNPGLAGDRRRWAWLSMHLAVIGAGILLVSAAGCAAPATSTSWSVGHNVTGQVIRATIDFLPAVAFFGAPAALTIAVLPPWAPRSGWSTRPAG
jgi:hypothetical protein